jgi:hypothetical protein
MARDNYQVPQLKYAPAKRGVSNMLIMLAGTWGTGKTKSALELATGLAEGGPICVADTENGRARAYSDDYSFEHVDLKEPYRPELFEEAATIAQKRGAKVWICDNFSWEHIGPGGQLAWHKAELDRMAGDNHEKRNKMLMTAWIEPKAAHTQMLQRFWQLNCHIILCVQAKKKIEMVRDSRSGKLKPSEPFFSPVCGDDIPYAMSTALMLWPGYPGVPSILKPNEYIDPLIPLDRPLTKETGKLLAAYARGEKPAPSAAPAGATQPLRGEAKNVAVAEHLVARFKATRSRAEHAALTDDDKVRAQIEWLQRARPALFEKVNDALAESWTRGEPAETTDQPAGEADPPPAEAEHDEELTV